MSLNSSTSANSNKAIRLEFLPYARKRFKKMMGSKHLAKHEVDNEQLLTCHNLNIKKSELTNAEEAQEIRNTTLFTILYIALNMIEDDIQLSDMRRYILEGRLTLRNIQKFFSENILEECMKVCSAINYRHSMVANMFTDTRMLAGVQQVCTQLSIPDLKLPSILRLCQRYITELALPKDLNKYVERLINIYKPEMRWTGRFTPLYEARAMAYIIFILKLLFGLDDSMEHEISESSRKINETVPAAKLFVFDDWLKYLEMRKVILSQAYMPFSVMFKTECDSNRRYEFLKKEHGEEDATYFRKIQVDNLSRIIDSFLSNFHQDEPEEFDFSLPSLTPNFTYFQTILNSSKKLTIPDFMHSNPSDFSIAAFINPRSLKNIVKDNMYKLKVEELKLREHVEIEKFNNFRTLYHFRQHQHIRAKTVDFDIDSDTWEDQLKERRRNESFVFGNEVTKQSFKKRLVNINRKEQKEKAPVAQKERLEVKQENLFDCLSESEDDIIDVEEDFEELIFKTSKMEYWSVMGTMKNFTAAEFEVVRKKLPLNLRWLVGYCANILDTNWQTIYNELLTIEATFIYVLEPMDSVTNMVNFKNSCDNLVNGLRLNW